MVARKALPPGHHVMRLVPYKAQHRHPDTDAFIAVLPTAFELRPRYEGCLSVCWIEHFGGYDLAAKRDAAIAFRETLDTKHIGGAAVFAAAQVDAIVQSGKRFEKAIRVIHDPVPGNAGHACVRHYSNEDLELMDVLATEVFTDVVSVKALNLPKK